MKYADSCIPEYMFSQSLLCMFVPYRPALAVFSIQRLRCASGSVWSKSVTVWLCGPTVNHETRYEVLIVWRSAAAFWRFPLVFVTEEGVCVRAWALAAWFRLFDLVCSVQRSCYNGTFHNQSLAFFCVLKAGVPYTLGQLLLCVCVCMRPSFSM